MTDGRTTTAADTGLRAGPLRPLGVAELLDTAVRAVRYNARASFAIALPIGVGYTALLALTTYSSLGDAGGFRFLDVLLQLFLGSLSATLLAGLLTPLYVTEMLGGRLTAAQTLRRVGRSALPLIGLTFVVAVALEIGVVALVVGGVWLWGVWALAAPALVSERLGPLRALRRSFDLARTGFWRIWGTRALAWLVTTALGALVTLPLTALASAISDSNPFTEQGIGDAGVYVAVTSLGTLLVTVVLAPVAAAVESLLYLDARMRREGMDLVLALDALPAAVPLGRAGATASPTW